VNLKVCTGRKVRLPCGEETVIHALEKKGIEGVREKNMRNKKIKKGVKSRLP
jgi:hypothetical protein